MRNTGSMRLLAALAVTAALAASAGCVRVSIPMPETTSDSDRVDAGGATQLTATIEMGAGRLMVTGGADAAMDAEYEFSDTAWRPEVDYEVRDGEGRLSVRTPSKPRLNLTGRMRYEWQIALTDELPVDLSVTMGAGESDLYLDTLDLRRLQVTLGAGDATIDLAGDPTHDLDASITAGAGSLTVRVPADVGVRVIGFRDGLGSYSADGFELDGDALVNDAYENADVRFDIELRRGLGDVTIETVE